MIVHGGRRLIYLAAPKTATRSTIEYLTSIGFCEPAMPVCIELADGSPPRHRAIASHPGDDWEVFTTVRNHFDAFVSWWTYRRRAGAFDSGFIQRLRTTDPWIAPVADRWWDKYTRHADHVLHYERLEDDLADLLKQPVRIPHIGVSALREPRPYQGYYGDEMREYVEKRFAGEMSELGYSWDER